MYFRISGTLFFVLIFLARTGLAPIPGIAIGISALIAGIVLAVGA